ncbi:MAG: transposase, partial [Ruminococcus bromii]|nr:transposase [Ruminococcus bromii]
LTNSLIISAGAFVIKKTSFQALIFLFPLLLERKSIIHFYTNFSAVSTGILNSFSYTITNGFTEGCNNKIKVLKRNAYGYRNFNRFRNRILHIFSLKSVICQKQATA